MTWKELFDIHHKWMQTLNTHTTQFISIVQVVWQRLLRARRSERCSIVCSAGCLSKFLCSVTISDCSSAWKTQTENFLRKEPLYIFNCDWCSLVLASVTVWNSSLHKKTFPPITQTGSASLRGSVNGPNDQEESLQESLQHARTVSMQKNGNLTTYLKVTWKVRIYPLM